MARLLCVIPTRFHADVALHRLRTGQAPQAALTPWSRFLLSSIPQALQYGVFQLTTSISYGPHWLAFSIAQTLIFMHQHCGSFGSAVRSVSILNLQSGRSCLVDHGSHLPGNITPVTRALIVVQTFCWRPAYSRFHIGHSCPLDPLLPFRYWISSISASQGCVLLELYDGGSSSSCLVLGFSWGQTACLTPSLGPFAGSRYGPIRLP